MKKIYTCPMHPEIKQDHPGKCPKCGGMELVLQDQMVAPTNAQSAAWKSYLPLIVIIGILLLTSFTLSLRDLQLGLFTIPQSISYFMIGFFLVFSGFKLIDLKGFAEGYSTYDLLAKRWFGYGYIYPFIELFFGLSMILFSESTWLLLTEIGVMTFSGFGVAMKLARKERFQCACLGTFLKVPLTKVTVIEDFGMALLALVMVVMK